MPKTYAVLSYSATPCPNRNVIDPWLQPGGSWYQHIRYGNAGKVLRLYEQGHFDGGLILLAPFGIGVLGSPSHQQEFDAFPLAREEGFSHLVNGFAAAWRPVTRRMPVTCYLGHLGSGSIASLPTPQYLRRVAAAIEPVLAAGMKLGMDAAGAFKDGSREAATAAVLAVDGLVSMVEPIQNKTSRWCWGLPSITIETSFEKLREKGFPDERAPGPDQPELIRFVTEDPAGGLEGWRVKIAEVHAEGHSVAVAPWAWIRELSMSA